MPLPAGLVVKNGSKRAIDDVLRHADAGVANAKIDAAFLLRRLGDDLDAAAFRHGVARIDDEIEDGEFELIGVGAHPARVRMQR